MGSCVCVCCFEGGGKRRKKVIAFFSTAAHCHVFLMDGWMCGDIVLIVEKKRNVFSPQGGGLTFLVFSTRMAELLDLFFDLS